MAERSKLKTGIEKFFGGKGFYIVLFACLAVIGVSAWALFLTDSGEEKTITAGEASATVMAPTGGTVLDEPVKLKKVVPPEITHTLNEPEAEEADEEAAAVPEAAEETAAEETKEEKLTFIWPVSGDISMIYSPDTLQFSKTMADWRTHDGVDIVAQIGTKVVSAAAGKVESVTEDDLLGTTLVIDHGSGIKSVYANLAATPTVAPGDAVTMGSVIGAVGDTALGETGEVSHLHFSMTCNGESADPADYLPRKAV